MNIFQEIQKLAKLKWNRHVPPYLLASLLEERDLMIRNLGYFDSSRPAENLMATLPYCADRKLRIAVYMYKYSTVKLTAIFIQTVYGNKCFQICLSAKSKNSRTITFTDETCSEIESVGSWVAGSTYTDMSN